MDVGEELNGNPPQPMKRRSKRLTKAPATGPSNPFTANGNPVAFEHSPQPQMPYPTYPGQFSMPSYLGSYQPFASSNPFSSFTPNRMPTEFDCNFASLPCVNNDGLDSSSRRRFSDPCLQNDNDSSTSSTNEMVLKCLMDQINFLKESNRKLYMEVQELRSDMATIKHQLGSRYERDYFPGMLTDIIREFRDAARIREEALVSKVKHMIEEKQMAWNHLQLLTEKNRNNDRIGKLEDQLKNLVLSNSRGESPMLLHSESPAHEVLELEQESFILRRDLQDAVATKKDAEAKILKLNTKLSILRNKFGSNSDVSTSIADDRKMLSSIDNCSLSTTSASSPVTVPKVTMSGPVTDL